MNVNLKREVDAYLRRRGLSGAAWALELGISRQRLQQILAGQSVPSLPLALRMARASGLPIEWFAGAEDGRVSGSAEVA